LRHPISIAVAIAIIILLGLSFTWGYFPLGDSTNQVTIKETEMEKVWLTVRGNQTNIQAGDKWGEIETFGDAPTGTLSRCHNVSLIQSPGIESVILDHHLWIMMRSNSTDAPILNYTPEIQGNSWNISFEAYAPNGNDNLSGLGQSPQGFGLKAFITDREGTHLAGAELSYGSPGYSFIKIFDGKAGTWEDVSNSILPSTAHKSSDHGTAPDRYIISFRSSNASTCIITVQQTAVGIVGSRVVTMPGSGIPYQLTMKGDATIFSKKVFSSREIYCGAWIVNRLGCRGGTARYPIAEPIYEYINGIESLPSSVIGAAPSPIADATVTIAGARAVFNETTWNYEALLPAVADWCAPVNYSVMVDGATMHGRTLVTYVSQASHAAIAQWWNGWDWVSVFGLDDSSGTWDALIRYAGYDHPTTVYLMDSEGNASDLLPTQSEIGQHSPHLWDSTNRLFWDQANDMAEQGRERLEKFNYASRWDDPAQGGRGHTFISMANPGNAASAQLLYAEYLHGIRLDGRSSDYGAGTGNNVSQLGCWYLPGKCISPGSAWYPYTPMDLMDAGRQLSTDNAYSWNYSFGIVDQIARNHGALRLYGHPNQPNQLPALLHWIDERKTNYTFENWKATDGEVASYIYGRWSTWVKFDAKHSNNGTWTYIVARKNPQDAGYWSVPLTVMLDTHGRTVKDVVVGVGAQTYDMINGSLKNLRGSRVMDAGYDLRDGKLYVSHFWNESALLTVTFADSPSTTIQDPLGNLGTSIGHQLIDTLELRPEEIND
jgi:hypothetical protein